MEYCTFENSVDFRGATFAGEALFKGTTFTGDAGFIKATFSRGASFDEAIFRRAARFNGATFARDAWFNRTIFRRAVWFNRTSFRRAAWFNGTTFARDAGFDKVIFNRGAGFDEAIFTATTYFNEAIFRRAARFNKATFRCAAWFAKANFTDDASFDEATFGGDASFDEATFTREARFDKATFTGTTWFKEATFTRDAGFEDAIFTGDAVFKEATFDRMAVFDKAIFTGTAMFDEATFTGDASFDQGVAQELSFKRALFSAPDPGPWRASCVSLERTTFAVRSRISITATIKIDARWLQAREGAHLVLRCREVDLSDSEFLRRSVVSSLTDEEHPTTTPSQADSAPREAPSAADVVAETFRTELESRAAAIPPRCRLTSLARANVGELVLSDVDLDDCLFAGAHGLDKLRIGARCSFQPYRHSWEEHWPAIDRLLGWATVRRDVIAEERQWRDAHPHIWPNTTDQDFLPAVTIAGIYRDLRKGREDAKDEPGAADFYYGEMEMRRRAGCKPVEAGPDPADASSSISVPSWVERLLLYRYWVFSGYGLRASRALLTLAAIVVGAAILCMHPMFARATQPPEISNVSLSSGAVSYGTTTKPEPPNFAESLKYTARESISLLRDTSAASTIEPQGFGTIVDILLRLAGPVLLAFAILALRARTKR